MKLSNFKLVDEVLNKDKFDQLVYGFNQTERSYPHDKTIHELYRQMAVDQPQAIAVVYKNEKLTYRELDEQSDRLAAFLTSRGINSEQIIGILMDKSVNMIVALLGTLKAGAAYLPLSTDLPAERIKIMLHDSACPFLISEKQHIKTVNTLQWECSALQAYLCMDSDDVFAEEEPRNELMEKELWDYVGEKSTDDISGGGWVNSYTGEDLSRKVMDEYAENVFKKLAPLVNKDSKVLEIACSSGVTMFRIAPLVKEYIGIDLSSEILAKTKESADAKGLDNIKLTCMPAHEIEQLNEKDFDVIILNSVIQCFNGHNYLRDVLKKALGLLNETGIIFAGDIMDQDKKDELASSTLKFRQENAGKGYTTKTEWSNELFVSQKFFDDLRFEFPEIEEVKHLEKIYTEESELTRFRYDTLIKINKNNRKGLSTRGLKNKYQFDRRDLLKVETEQANFQGHSNNLAYVMYTSGSTGKPKGVLVEHRSVVRLVKNTDYIEINKTDRIAQSVAIAFDPSIFEIWGALLNGAGLYLVNKETILIPNEYEDFLKQNEITVSVLPAALFNTVADHNPSIFSGLHTLIIGGDVLSPSHVNAFRKACPHVKLINAYGPTENTAFSACFTIEKEYTLSVPIGKPIANSQCYVLDKNNNPQPIGIAGELFVSGDGLARGYLNNEEQTSQKFIDHPFLPGKKMYRTGDQAKWMPDGNLEFLGRTDHQVKISGYRIELGEIESLLRAIGGVNEVVVIDKQYASGEKYLCAYLTINQVMQVDEIKAELLLKLPDYMIPSHFIVMDKLPLNENGKVDRKALPEPGMSTGLQNNYTAPSTEMEKVLEKLWCSLLERERVGIHDSFFDLGGNSLKATRMVSRLYKETGIKLDLRAVFTTPFIASLAAVLERAEQLSYRAIETIPEQEYYDVSHAQKRLWVLSQLEESSVSYNMTGAYLLEGAFNKDAFQQAYRKLLERHESLRTVFAEVDGVIKQKILVYTEDKFYVETLDLRDHENGKTIAKEMVDAGVSSLFNLSTGPLIRVKLICLKDQEYVLLFSMHHIISDGWSMEVLVKDILSLYSLYQQNGEKQLKSLAVQYKDYAAWQNKQVKTALAKQKQYWLDQLKDVPVLQLPLDKPRPKIQTFSGNRTYFKIDDSFSEEIKAYCRQQDVTLFMVILASVNVLFYRYTAQRDILVGSPVAGREHPDLEEQIGFYVNALALRTKLDPADTFIRTLHKVKEVALQAYANQSYPFDQIVDELNHERDLSQSALFNVMVALNGDGMFKEWSHGLNGVTITPFEQDKVFSMFDMSIRFVESAGSLSGHIEYNTDLFEESGINQMTAHLLGILQEMVKNPSGNISNITYLSPAEEKQLLSGFNNTGLDFEKTKTLGDLFDEQCKMTPGSLAVVYNETALTFEALQQRSDSVALYLKENSGIQPGDRVALCTNRSVEMVIGMLGILKAGGTYVPVDPSYPLDRMLFIMGDASCKAVLTDYPADFENYRTAIIQDVIVNQVITEALPAFSSDLPAYIIYTSGTTGRPKGVGISHRAVVNLVAGLNQEIYKNYTNRLRVALVAPCIFDASVQQIFVALLSGHTLFVVPDEVKQTGETLAEYYIKNQIDISDGAPVHLQLLSDALADMQENIPVKHYIIGGDVLSKKLVKNFYHLLEKKHSPAPLISNVYGPTECCVDVTHYTVYPELLDNYDTIPIGKPMANRKAYILDDNLQLMPIGTWGDLYIGGEGISEGYINLPGLTGDKFIPSPFSAGEMLYKTGDICRWQKDGNLLFQGRNDNQVKIRGYRIELNEIEKLLLEHKPVKETIVLAREDEEENKYLEAFFTSAETLSPHELAAHLRKFVPDYMVPSQFTQIEKFPLTPNGKIDKKALLQLEDAQVKNKHTAVDKTADNTEIQLMELWQELLKRNKIGVNESFFEIGGHSIKAVRLISLIQKTFRVRLHLRDIFMHNTIKAQAALITTRSSQQYSSIERTAVKELYELSHAQRRLWLLQQLEPASTAYNIPVAIELKGQLNTPAFVRAFETFVKRHESLRTIFVTREGEPWQKIIAPLVPFIKIEEIDLRNDPERGQKAKKYAEEEINAAFNLSEGPLVRLKLIQTEDETHLFLFTMHHIISDGWSSNNLLKEITLLYNAFSQYHDNPLQPLRIQYKDYAGWHNALINDEGEKHRQYWLKQFSGDVPVLSLPADFKRPDLKTGLGDVMVFMLPADLTEQLYNINRLHGTTLFMTLLSITKVFLYKYSDQTDITVGSSISGRVHPDLEEQIGFFVNTLPIRSRFEHSNTFAELLTLVKSLTLEAYEHQVYPFDKIVDDLTLKRDMSRSPLFDVMVELHNISDNYAIGMDGLTAEPYKLNNLTSRFDLIFNYHESKQGLTVAIEYNTDLFKPESIELMKLRFLKLLSTVVQDSSKPLADIDIRSEIEEQAINKLKTLTDVQELF